MSQAHTPGRWEKGHKLPPSMGACADELSEVRALRLAMEKEAESVKARETELREHIIANLSKGSDSGAAGQFYRAQIVEKAKVTVTDWPALHTWIRENNRFDLLQKRLGETAAMDYVQAENKMLPGCEGIIVPEISLTKIPGR